MHPTSTYAAHVSSQPPCGSRGPHFASALSIIFVDASAAQFREEAEALAGAGAAAADGPGAALALRFRGGLLQARLAAWAIFELLLLAEGLARAAGDAPAGDHAAARRGRRLARAASSGLDALTDRLADSVMDLARGKRLCAAASDDVSEALFMTSGMCAGGIQDALQQIASVCTASEIGEEA